MSPTVSLIEEVNPPNLFTHSSLFVFSWLRPSEDSETTTIDNGLSVRKYVVYRYFVTDPRDGSHVLPFILSKSGTEVPRMPGYSHYPSIPQDSCLYCNLTPGHNPSLRIPQILPSKTTHPFNPLQ